MREQDWSAARALVTRGQQAIERAFEGDPERLTEVFRQRAARLRQERDADLGTARSSLLSFELRGRRHAFPLEELEAVRHLERWTPVPQAAAHLLGVFGHGGEILPLFCLARLLAGGAGTGTGTGTGTGCGEVLILRAPRVALRVDRFEGVVDLDRSVLSPPEVETAWVAGVAPDGLVVLSSTTGHPLLQEVQ